MVGKSIAAVFAGNVGVAERVYRDGVTLIEAAASEVSGINQYRIDNQRSGGIISAELKAYVVHAVRNVTDRHFLLDTIRFLIGDRFALANVPLLSTQHEISHAIDLKVLNAAKCHLDNVRIGSRRDDKIIFEPALVAVIDHVDPWINLRVAHASETGNVGVPMQPDLMPVK